MNFVELSNYAVNQPILDSSTTQEELDQLNKALEAGSITGRETANLTTASGAPLKVESLEKTLKVITFREDNIVFWKRIPKLPAFNTVEEYNQLSDYGQDRGGFNNEGELPNEEDSTYVRRSQLVKFMGVTRSVTHPMTLVNTMIGSAIQKESENGTLWIMRKLDKALFTGNANIIPQEFNGIISQHSQNDAFVSLDAYFNSEVVIDLRGATLSEANLENGAEAIVENFGLGTQFYCPPKVLSDFVKTFQGNKFIQPNTAALTDGVMGQRVKSFESQYGNIGLNWDIFLNGLPTRKNNTAATSNQSANAPTAGSVAPVATDTSGKWASTDAGNYFYVVTSLNRYGESASTVVDASVAAIVAGGSAALTFTDGGGTNTATGYRIYRSNKNASTAAGATFYPLFEINLAQLAAGYDGGGAGVVRDRNRFLPDCNQAFLIEENDQILSFKQLAPIMKMDLAIVSPAFRFMILMYGTPFLYAPKKMVRFINIGKAA